MKYIIIAILAIIAMNIHAGECETRTGADILLRDNTGWKAKLMWATASKEKLVVLTRAKEKAARCAKLNALRDKLRSRSATNQVDQAKVATELEIRRLQAQLR
jgi:hypothetical protein